MQNVQIACTPFEPCTGMYTWCLSIIFHHWNPGAQFVSRNINMIDTLIFRWMYFCLFFQSSLHLLNNRVCNSGNEWQICFFDRTCWRFQAWGSCVIDNKILLINTDVCTSTGTTSHLLSTSHLKCAEARKYIFTNWCSIIIICPTCFSFIKLRPLSKCPWQLED